MYDDDDDDDLNTTNAPVAVFRTCIKHQRKIPHPEKESPCLARSSKEQTERAVAHTALFVRLHAASRGAPARLS